MKTTTLIVAGMLVLLSCNNSTKETTSSTGDTTVVKEINNASDINKDVNNSNEVKDTSTAKDSKETNDDSKTQPLTWKEFSSGNDCSIEKPMTVVITSQQQLDALWSKAFNGDSKPVKRAVDFSKSSVVAIFQGTVNTGGHSVVITSIKNNEAGRYIVDGVHKLPGKGCMSSMAIEYPYYIAVVSPAINEKTAFTIKKKETACE